MAWFNQQLVFFPVKTIAFSKGFIINNSRGPFFSWVFDFQGDEILLLANMGLWSEKREKSEYPPGN